MLAVHLSSRPCRHCPAFGTGGIVCANTLVLSAIASICGSSKKKRIQKHRVEPIAEPDRRERRPPLKERGRCKVFKFYGYDLKKKIPQKPRNLKT